jgi:hypothetical protein
VFPKIVNFFFGFFPNLMYRTNASDWFKQQERLMRRRLRRRLKRRLRTTERILSINAVCASLRRPRVR